MSRELIYLDTYILQKDMRIRLPKSILANLNAEKGVTKFKIYYAQSEDCIVLKKDDSDNE